MSRTKLRLSPRWSSDKKPATTAGRVGVTLFFLFWLAIPTIILVVIARDTWKNAQTWRWTSTPCTIVRSAVDPTGSDGDYAFRVEYTYPAGQPGAAGTWPTTSAVYARGYKGSSDYAEAQRLALRFPPGTQTNCYVNPANPAEAVLKRNSLATGAIVLFPMLFIAIGLGGLWFTWRGGSPSGGTSLSGTASESSAPMSSRAAKKASPALLVLLFGAFAVLGGVLLAVMGGRVLNVCTAKSWLSVPATVVSSRVRSHSSGDGTTYSVDVLYRYELNGREYRSNRYGFMRGSSSGYDGKREVVGRFPAGTRVTAYVNPADPGDAVLERGFTPDMLFLLIPGVFMAIGIAGVGYAVRRATRTRLDAQWVGPDRQAPGDGPARFGGGGRSYTPRRSLPNDGSPVALTPRQSPGLKLFGVTVAALFWNGIVSVFLFKVINGWSKGHGDACLTAFLVPFVGVGLALVVAVGHTMLALFNPRPVLVLGGGGICLGGTSDLRWSFTGRAERIHQLVVRLEGREEATYRQGTDTRTDKNTFFSLDLVDTTSAAEIPEGKAQVDVSADSMHSFTAANNKIVWVLSVHGHIRGWPDVKDEYLLTVAPAKAMVASVAPAEEPQVTTWNT